MALSQTRNKQTCAKRPQDSDISQLSDEEYNEESDMKSDEVSVKTQGKMMQVSRISILFFNIHSSLIAIQLL